MNNYVNMSEVDKGETDWLNDVASTFRKMPLYNKLKTFNALLDHASPEERYYLVELVSQHLRRDIFVNLPTELQEHICHYIDAQSLLVVCSVSKEWNAIISSLSDVWCRKYKIILQSTRRISRISKTDCIEALKLRKGIKTGNVFQHNNVSATSVSLDQITGLSYCEELLVGSSGDHVGIWHTPSFKLMSVLHVPCRISCLHVCKGYLLAFGHSTGCLTTWTLDSSSNATLHCEYISHTGVIMSVNVDTEMDLMASGGTDFSAKLWSVSSGRLLKTLVTHSHWVLQVTLMPVFGSGSYETNCSEQHSLLTMTRDHIRIFSWNVDSNDKTTYGNVSVLEKSVIELPLNSVHKFFTPGCHVVRGHAIYVKQTLPENEEGFAEIIFQNLFTRVISRRVRFPQNIRKLLAVGDKFALLLLPHSHYSKLNLVVVELVTGEIIGGCHLPHSSSSTPDLSQVTLGNMAWLDDLSAVTPGSVVIALGLPHGQVRVITWADVKRTADQERITF